MGVLSSFLFDLQRARSRLGRMHGIFINFKKFLGHEIFFTTCLRRQAGQGWCRPYSVKTPPLTRIQLTQTSQLIRHFTLYFYKHKRSYDQKHHFKSVKLGGVLQAVLQFSRSVVSLCDPMNRSTPGLPVHHQLPEFTQTHVHRVGDAIQPSHPLSSPSPPAPSPSQHQGLFQ